MQKSIILSLFFIFYGTFLQGQSALNLQKITPRLQEAIEADPTDYHHFYIQLADKVDVRAMDQAFYRNKTSLKDRSRAVIHALKTKANLTQKPILTFLKNNKNTLKESIESRWIANVIFVKAKVDVIATLSNSIDIEMLDLNAELQLNDYSSNEELLPPAPNGVEPGLQKINAPAMWELGYTGHGRRALIVDTGVDPIHPAYAARYWGNVVADSLAWYNHSDSLPTPFDCGDHGTHVTGTVLGLDRNNSDTIGVAFGAHWMGAPALCGATIGGTVESFEWAIDPDRDSTTISDQPDVINNSWYDPRVDSIECTSVYFSLLSALEASGVGVIFAAGNFGPNPMTITPPSNINWDLVNVFAVAAVNGNSNNLPIANFSSRGPSRCGDTASLLIKPEVSAPGENVRSSVLEGGYASFSGTSMAAPHVAGAFLLLKQAFPFLTGTEIKLALYFTANDLGAVGEDNTFGMGIIDVFGAYNYLVNQGYAPVPAQDTTDAVLAKITNIEEYQCDNNVTPIIKVINGGSDTLTSATVVYTYSFGLVDSIQWTGHLAPKASTFVTLPTNNLGQGEYELSIEIKRPNGLADDRKLDNRLSTLFFLPDEEKVATIGDTVCIGNEAILEGSHSDTDGVINWFNGSAFGGTIDTGTTFITPPINTSRNYYAGITKTKHIGKQDSIGGGGFHQGLDRHLIFDAHRPFTLKSVKVYADSSGGRLIALRKSSGANILVKPKFIAAGEQRIDLNFSVPKGKNLQLALSARNGLYRNDGNINYPYEIGEAVTIHGSNATNPTDYYYYFYDWEIEYTNICDRTATWIEVIDSTHTTVFSSSIDTININLTSGTVFFADSSLDAVSWFWDFGNGSTSTLPNPSTVYTMPGVYEVILRTESNFGCSDLAKKIIVVEGVVSTTPQHYAKSINVFPNPSNGQFNVNFDLNNHKKVQMTLVDVAGRMVKNYGINTMNQQTMELDLSNLGSGIYYLRMDIEGVVVVKKLVKI